MNKRPDHQTGAQADLRTGDCEALISKVPDFSIDAIVTDPPYYRVKDNEWDRQWKSRNDFLAWFERQVIQWQRTLRWNGSLVCFCSPQLSAHVETTIDKHFRVLNSISWVKPSGMFKRQCIPELRCFFPQTERIIFAEHRPSQNQDLINARREDAGVWRDTFEPLRQYLDDERKKVGLSIAQIDAAWRRKTGKKSGMAGHWFGRSQWQLPTEENYRFLQELFRSHQRSRSAGLKSHDELRASYDALREKYSSLKKRFDNMRRPFNLVKGDQYTDVWNFKPVEHYRGKHPCEKPLDLMRHIIKATTREGATILDPFAGSGSTGVAALQLGRSFIGFERDETYAVAAMARLRNESQTKAA